MWPKPVFRLLRQASDGHIVRMIDAAAQANATGLHMYLTFLVVGVALFLFAHPRVPIELSATAVVAALLLIFYIYPLPDATGVNQLDAMALLAGFANPVMFALLSLLVIGQGLFQTGAVERPARLLARMARTEPQTAIALMLIAAAAISAFLNNTPVVVIFIPIVTAVAHQLGQSGARVLMPLAFICSLGGMTTLIGSSANLIAASLVETSGVDPIGFFDFAIPGLLLASIGACYVLFVLPYILARKAPDKQADQQPRAGKQFLAQVTLRPGHPWIGAQAKAGFFPDLQHMTVRMIQRGTSSIVPPFDDTKLQPNDSIMLAATRRVLTEAYRNVVLAARRSGQADGVAGQAKKPMNRMAEAVVAPGSPLIGRTIGDAGFSQETGAYILGIQRQSRMPRQALDRITLEAGDVLLILGNEAALERVRRHRDVLLLEETTSELPSAHHVRQALAIFGLVVATAALGLLPIAIAAMLGAVAMVATGCMTVRQAASAVDRRVFLLVGTAFALARPLEETGAAALLAHLVVEAFSPFGPAVLLSAIFLLVCIITNLLSNQATAALFAPIVVNAAHEIGVAPEPFVYALIFALNCSFATPMAYQTNLIVMGPGGYQFRDFLAGGLPLIILLWLTYSVFAPWYYGL